MQIFPFLSRITVGNVDLTYAKSVFASIVERGGGGGNGCRVVIFILNVSVFHSTISFV